MQAPIFVNKQIVLADAKRIVHGMDRSSRVKSTYDVLLDRLVAFLSYLHIFGLFHYLSLILSDAVHQMAPIYFLKNLVW